MKLVKRVKEIEKNFVVLNRKNSFSANYIVTFPSIGLSAFCFLMLRFFICRLRVPVFCFASYVCSFAN